MSHSNRKFKSHWGIPLHATSTQIWISHNIFICFLFHWFSAYLLFDICLYITNLSIYHLNTSISTLNIWVVYSSIHAFNLLYTFSLIHSFIHSSSHSLIHSFIHPFIYSFIHPKTSNSFVSSFRTSLINQFIHSLIHYIIGCASYIDKPTDFLSHYKFTKSHI